MSRSKFEIVVKRVVLSVQISSIGQHVHAEKSGVSFRTSPQFLEMVNYLFHSSSLVGIRHVANPFPDWYDHGRLPAFVWRTAHEKKKQSPNCHD